MINKIRQELEKTEDQVGPYRQLTRSVSPEKVFGEVLGTDAVSNKSIYEWSLRKAEEKLPNPEKVLEKGGGKDFGICLRCENPIPVGRLMTRPENLYCFRCAG